MTFEMSRRRFMRVGAGAVGAAAAGSLLPPSLQAALASPVPPGGLESIEHVVLLMQENRAFDHYFGTLRGVRGFGDPNALTLRTGRTVYEQPDRDSVVVPYRIGDAAGAQRMDTQNVDALDHEWAGGQAAVEGGWHDGWIPAKTAATMAHYDRLDIPFQFELAESFTVCDAYHCSVPTSTAPNRNYWISGYTGFEADGSRAVTNDSYMPWHGGYTWTTVPERLETAGVSWRTYQEWDNFTDNNLEYFVRFEQIVHALLGHPVLVPYQFPTLAALYVALPLLPVDVQNQLLRCLDEGVARLDGPDRRLYDRALRRERPGTLADVFRADVEAAALPQVSYLVPSAVDCEHPMVSSPASSASLVYKVLDAIASDPDTWSKTAVLLNFDENDGYYDHVPPPLPPRDVTDEYVGDKPLGLGPRVPMTVISPWTVGGYVCSQVFDHTSVTQFLERRFGFTQPEISGWRRTVAGDLTSAFDFDNPRARPSLTPPPPAPPLTPRWKPAPPEQQRMPVQESGTRPARALPYQPDADVALDPEVRSLTVRMRNTGAESVHLALYPYAGEFELPRHFDVLGDHSDTVTVSGERYDLTMIGPNGFRREFGGSVDGPAARLDMRTTVDAGTRTLTVTAVNHGDTDLTVRLPAGAGRLAPGEPGSWSVPSRHGWYDASFTVDEDPSFRRRWMGHLENGADSVSQDPVEVAATGDLTLLPQPPAPVTGSSTLPIPFPGS
ncbi:phospholipase C [Rhodococcus sp. AG1013]|uniref:phosphocholine-specific phospholipase C n=1 Tax=Rhodococcus sp. AG1013 TaxID=2183996 RepID=UPI000E2B65FD|nr:phospholipase C, phosphocholine-specific [Rhodococcus sp. AG1013]RDI18923.1 phospholipase C [Rhodococcus sp. AG1013]